IGLASDPGHAAIDIGRASIVDFNRDAFNQLVKLQDKTSLPQRKFDFAQYINGSTDDSIQVNLDQILIVHQGTQSVSGKLNIAIAEVVAHEVAHTLGAIHQLTPVSGGSLMDVSLFNMLRDTILARPGANLNFAAHFGGVFIPVLKLALGLPVADEEFGRNGDVGKPYGYYQSYVSRDVEDTGGFNNQLVSGPEDTIRARSAILGVFDGPFPPDGPLPNTVDNVDFGLTTAGGTGSSRQLFLFNNGGQDLVINKIELLNGHAGFAIQELPPQPFTVPGLDLINPEPDQSTRLFTVSF